MRLQVILCAVAGYLVCGCRLFACGCRLLGV